MTPSDRKEWEALTILIGIISGTGRLKGSRPQSVILIGPPACGKSALLGRYQPENGELRNDHLAWGSTATSYGILSILKERVPRGVTHFVTPEFQTLMRRKGALWDAFLGIMLQAMEEGVYDIIDAGMRWRLHGARLGLIAACAEDAYDAASKELQATGFLSRCLVIQYSRTVENVLAARRAATRGDLSELEKIDCGYPPSFTVALPLRLADKLDDYGASLNTQEAHRGGSRFRALAQVIAFLDRKDTVAQKHIDALLRLEHFWRQT